MEELQINYQSVYYGETNLLVVSMNLLSFGYQQFHTTYIYENQNTLKRLCDNFDKNNPPNPHEIAPFAFCKLIDSVKITMCFESLFKSLLLANGFLIHKLDRKLFPILSKEQSERPIHFSEIHKLEEWKINPEINTDKLWLKNQINGITEYTLGIKHLTKESYYSVFGMNNDIINLCSPYFQYRDKLHYYMFASFNYEKDEYLKFVKIIVFLNKNLVRIQNDIIDKLNKGDSYKLPELKYYS